MIHAGDLTLTHSLTQTDNPDDIVHYGLARNYKNGIGRKKVVMGGEKVVMGRKKVVMDGKKAVIVERKLSWMERKFT